MIGLICDIFPDVDGGSRTIEDSLDMARGAAPEGINNIVATFLSSKWQIH
ncbi:CpsB/CapC family capsule biosynthesis tyrosine phosphatase [Priestia megaterium]|nr:CpsB/CapC family capsule biosynthesis tyrosine phosphatase [Priestia megaterium]